MQNELNGRGPRLTPACSLALKGYSFVPEL